MRAPVFAMPWLVHDPEKKMKFRSSGIIAAAVLTLASGQAWADLELTRKSGCTACHAVDVKVVGPAWQDIAARYRGVEGARDWLIHKVKTGGGGNWTAITGGILMPPYAATVSDADVRRLVDFVLGLETEETAPQGLPPGSLP